MTTAPEFAPGTPIWADLGSPDPEAAKAFYTALFGWDAFTIPDPEAGGYGFFLQDGKNVAGVGPIFTEGQPPAWCTYLSTNDAQETAQKVQEAGGQVAMEPMDVMGQGVMAIAVDPTGAVFGLWQPGAHRGADIYNTPVSMGWNELHTGDLDRANAFYPAVFGLAAETGEYDGNSYTELKANGRSVAGATNHLPDGVPAHWLIYFVVENCDATTARAQELGAQVVMPPMTMGEDGKISVLTDPQGATFGLYSGRTD